MSTIVRSLLATALVLNFGLGAESQAQEIGFVERFALANDREAVLTDLVPGTEDYYFYHCLNHQNRQQFDRAAEVLTTWISRHKLTPRARMMRQRQALLTYGQTPDETLKYITDTLNLRFDHERERLGEKPNLPSELDPKIIGHEQLTAAALRHPNLDGFEATSLRQLATTELTIERRRVLLQRLQRPDLPNLVELISADLQSKNSGGFGSLPIHGKLLLAQLDSLLSKRPELRNHQTFVSAYIRRLRPQDDADWRHDPEVQQAYLTAMQNFVATLGPAHNSLKVHVAYHQLDLDRSRGKHDHRSFMAYLKLPRHANYINPTYLQRDEHRRVLANLQQKFTDSLLPPVGDDTALVRNYFLHFFRTEDKIDAYLPYVRTEFLKRTLAEAKIVAGLGNAERWSSLLTPSEYQALKDRVDLEFDVENAKVFGRDAAVSLDMHVKNVRTLIVKVFQINTTNYYRQEGRQVAVDIPLDGLVPNWQRKLTFDDPPLRRMRRHFEFPELSKPGVYVVDFIGNGRNSRAIIRKGQLRVIQRPSVHGQVLSFVDERDRHVKDASVWYAGKLFEPNENGLIVLPYSTAAPAIRNIVIQRGDESHLAKIQSLQETYQLTAGIYVDRESLQSRKNAKVIFRPSLTLNGQPVSLSQLKKVNLTIASVDQDGVPSSTLIDDFKVPLDREAVHEFQTPPRLKSVTFTLRGEVEPRSLGGAKVALAASQSFALNGILATDQVAGVHLVWANNTYALELLGRSGEPLADRAVRVSLKHQEFVHPAETTLQTNVNGQVRLGALKDIQWVRGFADGIQAQTWHLTGDQATLPVLVHSRQGEIITLPLLPHQQSAPASLLETRDGAFVSDQSKHLDMKDGVLQIKGLLAGAYSLWLDGAAHEISIRVTDGPRLGDYAIGKTRLVQLSPPGLCIESVAGDKDQLTVQLRNASPFTRIHVIGATFAPAYSAFDACQIPKPSPFIASVTRRGNLFAEGRQIGDEYDYILRRQAATKFPGNMLERPAMLLNPWSLRSTDMSTQEEMEERDFAAPEEAPPGTPRGGAMIGGGREAAFNDFASLEFLAKGSLLGENLVPDADGKLEVPRQLFAHWPHVRILVVDPRGVIQRSLSLPRVQADPVDLRLAESLDITKHYIQRQSMSSFPEGGKLEISRVDSGRLETYDSLRRVYSLYETLNNDPRLAEFRVILDWPSFDEAKKRETYSKLASHELNVFLLQKDPQFFEQVVSPYLESKRDKTFVDQWLLNRDLAPSLTAWKHEQLNIFEKILLGRQIQSDAQWAARHVRELYEIVPPNPDRLRFLFDAALQSGSLDREQDGRKQLGLVEDRLARLAINPVVGDFAVGQQPVSGGINRPAPAPADSPEVAEQSSRDLGGDQGKAINELARLRTLNQDATPRFSRAYAIPQITSGKKGKSKAFANGSNKLSDADEAFGDPYFDDIELAKKSLADQQALYRILDKTQEWAENNYYLVPIEEQGPQLVQVNAFWNDYAAHVAKADNKAFLSTNFADASRNFTECMLALSVLDLPFESPKFNAQVNGDQLTIKLDGAAIVLQEQLESVPKTDEATPILVSQNLFRQGDRHRYIDNERVDKYVTGEFLTHTVYGCQVVVTNPTSSPQKLDVLLQVPEGAIAVGAQSKLTRSEHLQIGGFSTQAIEYLFYFPLVGEFSHYPVQVSKNGQVLGDAEPRTLKVVGKLGQVDKSSWTYVSQNGSNQDVLRYLRDHNLSRTSLSKIAFRMKDPEFFSQTLNLLRQRHAYSHDLWSYSVKHNRSEEIQEFLSHATDFVNQCGGYLDSPLLTIDPVERRTYQHLDYRPLVNARTHQLGASRTILNQRFHEQYHRLLENLAFQADLSADDRMAATYYLLLQDRIADGIAQFSKVNADQLDTKLQYDYFKAYVSLYQADVEAASVIAEKYVDYPVDRWRKTFAAVAAQIEELRTGEAEVVDDRSREQQQTKSADASVNFDLQVKAGEASMNYQNVETVTVNYYLMDLELLFSRSPFVQEYSGQFSHIRPNLSEKIELKAVQGKHTWKLPKAVDHANVLVEVLADGVAKTQAYYSHSLATQVVDRFGQVRVSDDKSRPLAKVYVKVYAEHRDGSVRFYKDGYTDLRGRFDYSTLSTNSLDNVKRFSLLIMSEQHGAVVREAQPPAR